MRRRWFFFFFRKSVSQRKGRVIIAASSVMLAVAVITSMIGITVGIREKLGAELKAYGANILVSAQKGDYLDYGSVEAVAKMKNIEEATGQVFGKAFIGNQPVEVIGLDFDKIKERGWRLSGSWPSKKGEAVAGVNIKNALKLNNGAVISASEGSRKMEFVISGFIEKGGDEDNALITSIPDIWGLLGLDGKLSAILVRGKSKELNDAVKVIREIIPSASVKTQRQVAFAEESLLFKIQLLMLLVTAVVLLATAISVASTMGANVLERREEIGLMKAIGATRNDISLFYRAESLLIGFSGGIAGFVLGYLSAQAVSKGAFNSFINMPFYISLASVAIGLIISMAASYFPVRDAMRYNPAVILRGE